jgi:5-methylcytosine-specific restriction endonuclease McrA
VPFKDPARGRAWAAEYRAKNREKERAKQRAWVAANRERRRAWERAYRQLDYVKSYRSDMKTLFRMKLKEAYVEPVSRRVVWERDKGICGICGEPADRKLWHLDHITPLVLGGLHCYENVQVSHPRCNMAKGGRTLEAYRLRQDRESGRAL